MKANSIIFNFLCLIIVIYPSVSYSCNFEVKDLLVKSDASEEFTNKKFLIKSEGFSHAGRWGLQQSGANNK